MASKWWNGEPNLPLLMIPEVPDNLWFCQGQPGSETSRQMKPEEAQH